MTESLEKNIIVPHCWCDLNERIFPAELLRQVEQIGTDHCDLLGLDADFYRRSHTAFLLAKVSLQITGEIRPGDALRLYTRPAKPMRAVFPRYTIFYNGEGDEVAACDARWVLIDTQTRRILRKPEDALPFSFPAVELPVHDLQLPRLSALRETGDECASYSRVDHNGHLNNTRYADIVCDHLPPELISHRRLSRLLIHYHNELRFGQKMKIFVAPVPESPNSFYVKGASAETTCFEALACFSTEKGEAR